MADENDAPTSESGDGGLTGKVKEVGSRVKESLEEDEEKQPVSGEALGERMME